VRNQCDYCICPYQEVSSSQVLVRRYIRLNRLFNFGVKAIKAIDSVPEETIYRQLAYMISLKQNSSSICRIIPEIVLISISTDIKEYIKLVIYNCHIHAFKISHQSLKLPME